MRVLVTGAGGFVGRALCPTLAAAGHVVVAGLRRVIMPRDRKLPGAAVIRPIGDLAGSDPLEAAVADVDAVVHLAARAHVMDETESDPVAAYRRVNVDGTRRLAESAARAGVRRFILLSSVKVNGEHTAVQAFTEDDAPAPQDAYGITKWEAEETVASIARGTAMTAISLRPPLVYGPGARANFLALLQACDSPWPLPLGGVTGNRRSLIYLANLTDAIRAALDHPSPPPGAYLLSDGEDLSTAALAGRLRAALGRPRRLLPVPPALLGIALRATGRRAMADRLLGSLAVDPERFMGALRWRPPHSVDSGLAATAAWYRENVRE